MTDLPSTVVGLIAFIILVLVGVITLLIKQQRDASAAFLTYIEKKNGIVEKLGDKFTESVDRQQDRFEKVLVDQAARHKEMLGDFAARLEATIPIKSRS